MTRIGVLLHNPKRTLGVLAVVLAAAGIAAGSGAVFTAQTVNPSNTFTAGSLTMSNSKDNAAILSASNMIPGDTTTGTVDIQNTGTVSGTFSVSRSALNDTDGTNPLSAVLDLTIKDCGDFSSGTPTCDVGDPVKYTGTLAGMTTPAALGSYAANDKHRYEFTVHFQNAAGTQYQSDSSTATFQWNAVQ
jgi:hypothetical protein